MRCNAEHDRGGREREEGEEDKAQPGEVGYQRISEKEETCLPVQHHSRKLPVGLDFTGLVVLPDLVGDHPDLLEDEAQLPLQWTAR